MHLRAEKARRWVSCVLLRSQGSTTVSDVVFGRPCSAHESLPPRCVMWRQAAFEGVGSMPMARIRNFRAEQQEAVDADMLRRGARRGGSGDPGASPAGPAASPAVANGGHPPAGAAQDSGSGAPPMSSADGQSSKGMPCPCCLWIVLCYGYSSSLVLGSRLLGFFIYCTGCCCKAWAADALPGVVTGLRSFAERLRLRPRQKGPV